ncbi:MAG TPA: hypothetical protein PKN80_00655, partial [bacterium]|nr:hypothetical protein [bacterium]
MERLIKNLRLVNFLLVIGLTLFGVPLPIFALPEGGQVVSGQASINVDGSNLTVTQGSNRAIVNWESFSIGEAELVQILQ